ncbi:MAG: M3 family metallopeptidase, partial [Myxococcales bacterium]|nr:M3 family metallopeptidase [Myxococcales bacterium]
GYHNFAEVSLVPKMADSPQQVLEFLVDLAARAKPFAERDLAELKAFAVGELGLNDMQPWDLAWASEKLKHARYSFSDEEVRQYFPEPKVLSGLFKVIENLYGVTIRADEAPMWHQDVRFFRIERGSEQVGQFYLDLYARDTKRGGAWMGECQSRWARPDGLRLPVAYIVCNATPPVGAQPALMTFDEVETLFHEFGHLLHHAFSEVPVESLGGTNVAWDFVELPSQIMENFCWERVSLDLFARHYETGEAIPEELFQKMLGARTYRAASAQMRQLGFATMDLRLHRELDPKTLTPDAMIAFARDVLEAHSATKLPNDYGMVCGFTHLFASPTAYASGYYSYKWAEVLDADAFTRFAGENLFDRAVGLAFRHEILARGNSRDPAESYEAFMGRGPDIEPLFARAGIEPPAATGGR